MIPLPQAPTAAIEPVLPEIRRSPEYVRLSSASAMALRLTSGRFGRDFEFGGINLLLNYEEGCFSDCAYCGLARSRPGDYEDQSFIRVEWPLLNTDVVIDRMAEMEHKLTRLCISMVTHGSAYRDALDITERIARKVRTPLSNLVAPPTLNYDRLKTLKEAGTDMIGIGLDAVTEEVFRLRRTDVPNGGLRWDKYWEIIEASREIYGPWKVNCHLVVGLGETDRDLAKMVFRLKEQQIFSYLFCFNPEPDSRMGDVKKSDISRWRRIQLIKTLIEEHDLDPKHLMFNDAGSLIHIHADTSQIERLVSTVAQSGTPFMTDGCPTMGGEEVGCTRPYGSYGPNEDFRDYPFRPDTNDMKNIWQQLRLDDLL